MEFVLQRKTPVQKFGGLAMVAIAHVLVIGTLMFGITRTIPRIAPPEDLTVVIIPDPPKPPPTRIELPTQTMTAPQHVVTPPILDIPPVVVEPTISVTPVVDVAPVNPGPPVAVRTDGSGTPATGLAAACPNAQGIRSNMRYPPEARRQGLQGDVLARFVVTASGQIRNIDIVSSSNRAFNSSVINAVGQFACNGQGRDVAVEVPFTFRLE